MQSSAYWKSELDYLQSNKPKAPENYYNKDFVENMEKAKQNIGSLVDEKDRAWSAKEQKQDEYDAFYGTMRTYDDVYKDSKREFGIEEHRDTYEKSKKALELAESTLSALPSTLNAASNRVLTQQQREDRYNVLADQHIAYRNNILERSSAYEDVWKKARDSYTEYVQAEIAGQWKKLADFNNAYTDAINEFTKAGDKIMNAKIELMEWERGYRDWQHNQYQMDNTVWLNKFNNALGRYSASVAAEMADRQAEIDMRNERLANSLVKLHHTQQQAKTTQNVVNAGGILGRIAYALSR